MEPILVIMAAGMGSRYGGMKQIDPIGPDGEVILDYSLFDAKRAGFKRVIFLIKHKWKKPSGTRSANGRNSIWKFPTPSRKRKCCRPVFPCRKAG